jgi:demethylmenaquinone methyltransferase/2-methoxy-6-polyprenyl-1,4-benzoquinol methylase
MRNTFYVPGEQRAAKVKELFARIARRYDLINDLQSFGLHRYWKGRVLRLARPQAGERALDVCCGTGDLAFGLARFGVKVVALDFSQEMLAVAGRRARGRRSEVRGQRSEVRGQRSEVRGQRSEVRGQRSEIRDQIIHHPPSFLQGDAQQLPFPDCTFDIVTVGYGLRNLASWETGLREMKRVTRPGGRLLVLDFGKPDSTVWRAVYFSYLRLFVPVLGWGFCGDAGTYAYILQSLQHYPAQRGVASQMSELGLANVRVVNLLGGVMSINYGVVFH